MKSLTISIADFIIKIQSQSELELALEEGFRAFILKENPSTVDILIEVHDAIPKDLLVGDALLFEAQNKTQKFYTVYQHGLDYKLIIYDQEQINEIQQIAILKKDLSAWTIYAQPSEKDGKIYPLKYPLSPLIMYYLSLRFEAIMLHSSGVFDGKDGRIFSGFSGVGKSTMAYLWQKKGHRIVNDDRLIIRKTEKGYFMYNTPMDYIDIPKKVPLQAIYLIRHAKENTIKKLNGALAVSRTMAFCIQHAYNKDFIEHHLAFLSEMTKTVSVYELGFLPDERIIDLIQNHVG